MKILCVEDGSVDIDAIENGELKDGKCLVYRQGSTPPFVLEIEEAQAMSILRKCQKRWDKIREILVENKDDHPIYQDLLNLMNELESENE